MKIVKVISLFACAIFAIFTISACDSNKNYILQKEVVSQNGKYRASIYIYSLGAAAPSGEKVYISNDDGTQKSEAFYAYGYDCDIVWIDENTIKIIVNKVYNQNYYSIKTIKDKIFNINIYYDKTIDPGFGSGEHWEP